MVSQGGGWTLAHHAFNTLPDLDSQPNALSILAVNQNANNRFVGSGIDAFYSGRDFQSTPSTGWTVLPGNPSSLFNLTWASINQSQYSIYVRETTTTSYPAAVPAAVPLPAAAWLMVVGICALGAAARRRRLG